MNLSKSGIGVSFGVKGARIGTGPGRGTYVHMGRYGLYYRQRIGGHKTKPVYPDIRPYQEYKKQETPFQNDPYEIKTADVTRLVETSSNEVLSQINNRKNQTPIAPFVGICSGILAYSVLHFLGIVIPAAVILVIGLVFTYLVHKGDKIKRTTPLFYELEEDAAGSFAVIQKACENLSCSQRIWRITSEQPNRDWKRHGGAAHLDKRKVITAGRMSPPFIATNLNIWGIDFGDIKLFLFPDNIFVLQQGGYAAIPYESFNVAFAYQSFIEGEWLPGDAEVIDYTWRFVNKKGGPDRRFNNNRQIPVANYGFLGITSTNGLNIHVHVSNHSIAADFANHFNSTRQQSFDEQSRRKSGFKAKVKRTRLEGDPKDKSPHPDIDSRQKSAHEILGIEIGASSDDISTAYHHMAQMYHPDKVAHLAPEFREIAEDRMKEINAAYAELRRQTSSEEVRQQTSRIIVECPKCFQKLRVPEDRHGSLKCPKCNHAFEA
jgi:hypothetical protein